MYSENYQAFNRADNAYNCTYTHVYGDILNESNNISCHYKCGKCIYLNYIYHNCVYQSAVCITDIYAKGPFNPKAFAVSIYTPIKICEL